MEEQKKSEDVASVDVHAAKDLLQKGHRYLDVRTVEEFNKSHVETALTQYPIHVPPEGRVKNPDFLHHLIVACNKGGRGGQACADLLNAVGFDHVSNLREDTLLGWMLERSHQKSSSLLASSVPSNEVIKRYSFGHSSDLVPLI